MLLLRHASAGERPTAASLDRARRLDRLGRADARGLPEAFAEHAIERAVSSPHARCVETVEALARSRNLHVELRDELLPDASADAVHALLDELPDATLLCTHRETIASLFGGKLTCQKGGAWLLERRDGKYEPVAYLPPPSVALRPPERAATTA
jgi:8-oxo-dGTP diphosphatase